MALTRAVLPLLVALAVACAPSAGSASPLASASSATAGAGGVPSPAVGVAAASSTGPSGLVADVGAPTATLVGAGDIAACDTDNDEATAKLLDGIAGEVFTLGDNAYEDGSSSEFARCYAPTWGRHMSRTHPAIGNHEYGTTDAAGYFAFFGAAAGVPGQGWYSYDVGAWHVIVLNSNCALVGCGTGSAQDRWLRADVAATKAKCTLAYWHHPLFSSGPHGGEPAMRSLWQALMDAGADVVLSAHDHDYERFAPQDADGRASPEGVREFVVGTGGRSLYPVTPGGPNSEAALEGVYGVLRLTLGPAAYAWNFSTTDGRVLDQGRSDCH